MPMFDPAHPGEVLRETIEAISEENGHHLTVTEVAQGLGVTRKTLSAILNQKQGISPEMSLRLAKAFGNTDAEFWLRLQENYDLAKARASVDVSGVQSFWHPSC